MDEKKRLMLKRVTIKNLTAIKGGGLTRTWTFNTICGKRPPPDPKLPPDGGTGG